MNWPNVALFLATVLATATGVVWLTYAALYDKGDKSGSVALKAATILSVLFLLTGVWAAGVAR